MSTYQSRVSRCFQPFSAPFRRVQPRILPGVRQGAIGRDERETTHRGSAAALTADVQCFLKMWQDFPAFRRRASESCHTRCFFAYTRCFREFPLAISCHIRYTWEQRSRFPDLRRSHPLPKGAGGRRSRSSSPPKPRGRRRARGRLCSLSEAVVVIPIHFCSVIPSRCLSASFFALFGVRKAHRFTLRNIRILFANIFA